MVHGIEIKWYLSIVEVAPQIKEPFRNQPVADSVRAQPVCRERLSSTLLPSEVPSVRAPGAVQLSLEMIRNLQVLLLLLLLLLLAIFIVPGDGQMQFSISKALWSQTFAVDVVVPGFSQSLSSLGTVLSCARRCHSLTGCKSFGFNRDAATCLLYDHLALYTTNGTAAPGTRYYWLLAPRCPSELNYTLRAGVCYKHVRRYSIDNSSTKGQRDICTLEGGHLFIADTTKKFDFVKSFPNARIGAHDVDKEGDWRWVNGNPVTMDDRWLPDHPLTSTEHNCLRLYHGLFRDRRCDIFKPKGLNYYPAVCEVPM